MAVEAAERQHMLVAVSMRNVGLHNISELVQVSWRVCIRSGLSSITMPKLITDGCSVNTQADQHSNARASRMQFF